MNISQVNSNILPADWLEVTNNFDYSNLSNNNQLLIEVLREYMKDNTTNSFSNTLVYQLINFIFFNDSIFSIFDKIPYSLMKEITDELSKSNETEWNFNKKTHSMYIEIKAYNDLIEYGYIPQNFQRVAGSCDLQMLKDNIDFNFEVKFKESQDIHIGRFFDIINGASLINENDFLRNTFFEINLKEKSFDDSKRKCIIGEINQFIENKNNIFEGKYIQIFNTSERDNIDTYHYNDNTNVITDLIHVKCIEYLIVEIFLQDNQHIDKMIKKSKKDIENFKGYLYWDIPFQNEIDSKNIEIAFNNILKIDFDLYIYLDSFNTKYNFLIKKCKN